MNYAEFLTAKRPRAKEYGVDVTESSLPDALFDYQRHCAAFALRLGRAGIYLDTGLGKTAIELAFAQKAAWVTNNRALILAPLAVAWQIKREADKFGIEARTIREQSEAQDGISICNYDRLAKIDPQAFGAVVLDEASVIKNYTGKTTAVLMQAFAGHRFRMAATATPAPNDHMELGQQAQFLGVMPSNEMLMRWFISDQTQMGRYRLKGHGERDFWEWMASWSRMAENPSDLGFPGQQFILPKLHVFYHRAKSDVRPIDGALFAGVASATSMHDMKRQTSKDRAELAAGLVDQSSEPAVLWCDTDYEADAIRGAIPEAMEVRGSQSIEEKEARLESFATGQSRLMLSKPSICGHGLNWQHCNRMIFVGRTFSYESYYQAVRRCWRYGQKREVSVHIIVTEGEDQIASVIGRKSDDHARMKRAMCEAMQRATGRGSELKNYDPQHNGRLPAWISAA